METILRHTAAIFKGLGLLFAAIAAVTALVAYTQGVPTDTTINAGTSALLAVGTVYGIGLMAESLLAQRYSAVEDGPGGGAVGPGAGPAVVPPGGLPPRPVAMSSAASMAPGGETEEDMEAIASSEITVVAPPNLKASAET